MIDEKMREEINRAADRWERHFDEMKYISIQFERQYKHQSALIDHMASICDKKIQEPIVVETPKAGCDCLFNVGMFLFLTSIIILVLCGFHQIFEWVFK